MHAACTKLAPIRQALWAVEGSSQQPAQRAMLWVPVVPCSCLSPAPPHARTHTHTLAGVKTRELACFRYDEVTRVFDFLGSNDEVKLVSEAKDLAARAKEAALSSLLR
jgi:hypothetical protein